MSLVAQRFSDRTILVTGAASGIGEASARRFAAEGARVALIDVSAEAAQRVAHDLSADGVTAWAFGVDVRDAAGVDQAIDTITAAWGEIDVLFTAAGVAGSSTPSHELSDEAWEAVLGINLTGTFTVARAVLRSMVRAGRGSIVTCGSTSSFVATLGGGMPAYRASKGGVKMLTQTLAMEYAAHGIRVNCVCPGAVVTNLKRNTSDLVPPSTTATQPTAPRRTLAVPMGRYGTADEIAATVAFLASDDASYITGQSLLVDGGVTAE